MKKQGYLITVYKDFPAVYELALFLSREDRVFIHVDRKSREFGDAELAKLNGIEGCRAQKTFDVAWGGYNHVRAFLGLIQDALADGEVSYLHLLTGEDFPLQEPGRLHRDFQDEEHIYLSVIEEKDFTDAVWKRCLYYNLFPDKNVKNPLLWQLQRLTTDLQRLCGVRRKRWGEFTRLYKGLVYISLPTEAAGDILSYLAEHPEYERDMRRCQVPEEFFFHTLLLNGAFRNGKWKKRIVDRELRYMDWEKGDGGSPAYLSEEDFEKLSASGCVFARKLHGEASLALRERIRRELW